MCLFIKFFFLIVVFVLSIVGCFCVEDIGSVSINFCIMGFDKIVIEVFDDLFV